jgi:hypothetical protein
MPRMAWGSAWTDTGRVFTREDGALLRPGWIRQRFGAVISRERLPPIRFHDLRHAGNHSVAAGQPPEGDIRDPRHATVAFTMDTYTEIAVELVDFAAAGLGCLHSAPYRKQHSRLTGRTSAREGLAVLDPEQTGDPGGLPASIQHYLAAFP